MDSPQESRECENCGAIGALHFEWTEPEGQTVYTDYGWCRRWCGVCNYKYRAFPLDPERPSGRSCFLGLHRWKTIGELGVNHYSECQRCGYRTYGARYHGARSPVAHDWLDGAPWAYEADLKIPPPMYPVHWVKKTY